MFLTIGCISASDNVTDANSTEQYNANNISTVNNTVNDESDAHLSNSSNSSSNFNNNSLITYDDAYEKTTMEYSSIISDYTSGNVIYNVKVYSVLNFNGTKYKDPKYNSLVKLRVYTGSNYKTYSAYIGNDGIASIKVPNLSIGYHKVEIFFDNVKRATSYIKVIKSTTKVYAPAKTIKFRKNTSYKIKVLDTHNNYVKYVILKVKVYTGTKYKTYSLKTNYKGIATFKTSGLSLGTHKIIISTSNKNYKVSKTSKIVIKRTVSSITTLKAIASAKTVQKGNSYDIKIVNAYDDPVKKVSLKINVYTGKKIKAYYATTNTNGIALLKTSTMSLGSHKLIITSNTKNYRISKSSSVTVSKSVPSNTIKTTVLKNVTYYPTSDGKYKVKLGWISKAGSSYQVLRKTNGSYALLSTVKSTSSVATFTDEIDDSAKYIYSVREIIVKSGTNILGPYDSEGLKLLKSPNVSVDFQNLKAEITWDKVKGATKYIIFRKVGRDGSFKSIGSVSANVFSYTDVYSKSASQLSSILNSGTFADPSFNSLFYTVRTCTSKTAYSITKTSYGLYLVDGDFHLEAPCIVSLKDNKIKWGKVPNADGYLILKMNSTDEDWVVIGNVTQKSSTTITLNLDDVDNDSYYTVKAFAVKNGQIVYSDFDTGFSLMNYSQENSKYRILYFGDSITYGSPYKSTSTRHIFSIPYRVAELLGCVYYNPSIPGSTYHDLGQKNGVNIENTNYYRYRICREVVDAIAVGNLPGNWKDLDTSKNSEGETNTSIDDYNIVVLSAGTNDYLDNTILGSINSKDTKTFYGALNHIMDKIEEASKMRVERGEEPIKVVFVDLYYSDRTYTNSIRENRDVTPNKIGLTLTDYQDALDNIYDKWNSSEYLTLYNFDTRDYDIVNQDNCPYTASDNLHFSKFTYGQYGNAFASFLEENVFSD